MTRPRRATLALLVLAAAVAAHAAPPLGRRLGPPLILRLDGVVATSREEAARIGFTTASFGVLGDAASERIWLGVDDARTIGGDNAINGKDVLESVAGYEPSFMLTGAKALVAQARVLPVGTRVRLEGLVDLAPRTFLLHSVVPEDAPE
jgi:hypothetical protein